MDLGASRFFFHPLLWERPIILTATIWSWETCSWSPAPFATALSHLPGIYTKTKGASSRKQHCLHNMRFEIQKLNYVPSWFLVVCNLESLEWGDSAHQMLFGHHTSWKLQPAASRRKAKRSLAWKVLGKVARVHVVWEPGNVRWCSAGPNWCLDWTNLLHFAGKIHKVSFYVSYMCVPLRMYQWIVLFPGPYVMHGWAPRHIGM